MTDWSPVPVDGGSRRRRLPAGPVLLRRGVKSIVALLSVAVLTLTWYGWQYIGSLNDGVTTTDLFGGGLPAKPLDGAIDILLVGQDSRTDAQGNPLPREVLDMLHAGESDGERQTDTMILVHIPQDGKQAVALSFPRDSWVDFAGPYGKHKLNGAFVYAYNDTAKTLRNQGITDPAEIDEKAKVAGRKELVATLEKFIGKPGMIDRYAEVNLASFFEVTKSIGGIEVCLNHAVQETKSGVNLPAGKQTVEGVQALAFVRQRHGIEGEDLGRIARQQAFLSGLARKVLSPEVLASPSTINSLVESVKKSVVLSKDWDVLEFVEQMRGLTGDNVEFRTIPNLGPMKQGGADVVGVEPKTVQRFVSELTGGGPSGNPAAPADTENAPTVELYNGSGDESLSPKTWDLLTAKGLRKGEDVAISTRKTTLVRYPPGGEAVVETIRDALGIDVAGEADADIAEGHARVLLGADYRDTASNSGGQGRPMSPDATSTATPSTESTSAGDGSSTPSESSTSATTPPEPDGPPITGGGVPCVN